MQILVPNFIRTRKHQSIEIGFPKKNSHQYTKENDETQENLGDKIVLAHEHEEALRDEDDQEEPLKEAVPLYNNAYRQHDCEDDNEDEAPDEVFEPVRNGKINAK